MTTSLLSRVIKATKETEDAAYSGRLNADRMIELLYKFLDKRSGKMFSCIEEGRWKNRKKSTSFNNGKEAAAFLKKNVQYKRDNYYISAKDFSWHLLICHEGDLHAYGSRGFVKNFRKLCS